MTQILIVFALATICGGGALITVASVLQLIESPDRKALSPIAARIDRLKDDLPNWLGSHPAVLRRQGFLEKG